MFGLRGCDFESFEVIIVVLRIASGRGVFSMNFGLGVSGM